MEPLRAGLCGDVGQRNLAVTANTYTHVLADEVELDYESMLSVKPNDDDLGTVLDVGGS